MSNATSSRRGFYIAVEGIDGSGKSGLVMRLATLLENSLALNVVVTKEPGGTELGKTLRELVNANKLIVCDKAEFLLFAADRAQHIKTVVTPALQRGTIVLSDRSFISSIAYQGFGRGLDCDLITNVNEWVLNGVMPDVILYLDLDPTIAYKRIEVRNEEKTSFEQEREMFWARVIKGFNHCCQKYPNMIRIDASGNAECVAQKAFDVVKQQMNTFSKVD